jgi:5-hydroxyisourate hydrolase
MPGKLTTHVLDTTRGKPAAKMKIELWAIGADKEYQLLKTVETNSDGRIDAPLLEGEALKKDTYQLVFHVGAYFRTQGNADAGNFFEFVPIDFVVSDASANYHVPLLVSPWSYSTYRGS